MDNLINKSSLRYLAKHPWQVGLSIIGIVLGVAVVISIDLANQSASKAFELSMQNVAGKATHHIIGGPNGIPDSLYFKLRNKHQLRNIAPIVEGFVITQTEPPRTFTLLGVDPFAERPFRSFLEDFHNTRLGGVVDFLVKPNSVLMSDYAAKQMEISQGDTITIQYQGKKKSITVAALLETEDERGSRALENILICDISTAQELLNSVGTITRIDLLLVENSSGRKKLERIKELLPSNYTIPSSETRSETSNQMVDAFRLNLTAMSLLALVVGMFLIYNTMTFSVVQRRTYIGLLRSIGVTKKEIFSIIINEALVTGFVGTVIGILVGIVLAKLMVQLISQTINDLYFVLTVRELNISPISLIKGLLLGVFASVFAALKPAKEATDAPPRIAIGRSFVESEIRKKIPLYTIIGFFLLFAGIGFVFIPTEHVMFGFISILLIILGFTFLTPITVILFMRFLHPLLGRTFGILARMASRGIETQISRTVVAVAALGIAVSASVGVGIMTKSMRNTVVHWLATTLQADLYISAPSLISRVNDSTLDASIAKKIENINGVQNVNFYRAFQINTNNNFFQIAGLKIDKSTFSHIRFKEGEPEKIWQDFKSKNTMIVTEPFSYKNNVKIGSIIKLPTEKGMIEFTIAGIYYDYSSDIGFATVSFEILGKHWNVDRLSGITVYKQDGADIEQLKTKIRGLFPSDEEILIRSNKFLLNTSVEIFDRTFLITKVLQVLAILVAFIGILSALMALQLERSREFGVLRANGLTPKQLWKLVTLQTGLMGFCSGLLSLPMGNILAVILIYIINKRSFGWTMQFEIMPETFIQAIILSITAALVAGIYPAYKMAKTSPALALREE